MKVPDLNQLFMQAPVAICIVSGPEHKIELVNERMLQFLGRTIDIVGSPLQQTLTEAREQGLLSIVEQVKSTGQTVNIANFPAVILINGVRETRYFNLVFKPFYFGEDDTESNGVFCVAHNVTEAVLAHQKVEEEKQRTALALEAGGLGMVSTDWQSNTVLADKRATEIFGLEGDQTLDAFLERIHPEDRAKREVAFRACMEAGSFDFEVRLLFPGGSIRWVRSRGMVQKNSERKITGTFGVVQDITAQKEFAMTLHREVEQRTADLEIANQSLQQVNNNLLRSNAALEEFARAASHDLIEPVRMMQVFTSRL
jgi:PAS domain S-box-containing protein